MEGYYARMLGSGPVSRGVSGTVAVAEDTTIKPFYDGSFENGNSSIGYTAQLPNDPRLIRSLRPHGLKDHIRQLAAEAYRVISQADSEGFSRFGRSSVAHKSSDGMMVIVHNKHITLGIRYFIISANDSSN